MTMLCRQLVSSLVLLLVKMVSQEAGLRCVLEGGMALCVMTPGTMRMPPWSAHNWDSHPMVREHRYNNACSFYYSILSELKINTLTPLPDKPKSLFETLYVYVLMCSLCSSLVYTCVFTLTCCFILSGAVAVTDEFFGDAAFDQLLSSVECLGNESVLVNCPLTSSGAACQNLPSNDAGVVCQGMDLMRTFPKLD